MPQRTAITPIGGSTGVSRREVLRWGIFSGAIVLLPGVALTGCGEDDHPLVLPAPTPVSSFLTADERRTIEAISARIIPSDDSAGAAEAGVIDYIDRLLSVVPEANEPAFVFAGGPFSGRSPFANAQTGTPSSNFPPNEFTHFLTLTRLQLLSWRVQILGSAAVPGTDFNSPAVEPVSGWRADYRAGVAAVNAAAQQRFGAAFADLTTAQQDTILSDAPSDFVALITNHTIEGMFCAPEYGGNANRIGWALIGYDGDSQPLGYSLFDESVMDYRERADKPNSTADPDEDFAGVDTLTAQFLRVLVRLGSPSHFP